MLLYSFTDVVNADMVPFRVLSVGFTFETVGGSVVRYQLFASRALSAINMIWALFCG